MTAPVRGLTVPEGGYMFAAFAGDLPEGEPRPGEGRRRMVLFNYATRELTAKIVYYGPGLCGKTTNLQYIHENLPDAVKGKMLSLATKTDRTLFFDFLPMDLGEIRGMKTRIQLYTVPGQVFYNETRKLVLKGADGIVFVADSQEQMLGANVESYRNLEENLKANGLSLADMPHVLQFNKRDLPRVTSIEELNTALNRYNAPFYESVATAGIGVQDTLRAIVKLVLLHLTRKYDPRATSVRHEPAAAAPPEREPQPAVAFGPASPGSFAPRPEPAAVAEVTAVPVSELPEPPPPTRSSPLPAPPDFFSREEETYEETLPGFDEAEIAALVEDVAAETPDAETAPSWRDEAPAARIELDGEASPAEEPAASSAFEIDRAFDPDWSEAEQPRDADANSDPAGAPGPPTFDAGPAPPVAPEEGGAERTVLLTTLARDADLFEDPSLEIARLGSGDAREIEVPVELVEGAARRRFKLSIRLRLDPVD